MSFFKDDCRRQKKTSRRRAKRQFASRLRLPVVEALESRRVLATFYPSAVAADGADGSLRDAIQQSNFNGEDDTIVLEAGTYTIEIAGGDEDDNLTGDFDIFEVNTTVHFLGAGTDQTIIDGNELDRIFDGLSRAHIKLENLTITGGKVAAGEDGGGVQGLGLVELDDVIIRDNTARDGGGVVTDASLIVRNSLITQNTATRGGGGIKAFGPATIEFSQITENTSSTGGGGISVDGGVNVFITDSTISGNTAGANGGGIENSGGRINELRRVTLSGNSAQNQGGGLANDGGQIVSLRNVTVSGNDANYGGGLHNFGGIYVEVINATIVENEAETLGGGFHNDGGDASFRNTLIANNTSPTSPDYAGKLTGRGYNLIENTDGVVFRDDLTGNITGQDPLLEPLADNGGPTFTHKLGESSPAIGAATTAAAPLLDQRGAPRDSEPDIGAFEFGSLTVDIVDVSPDPRNEAVGIVTIDFSDDVTGVDLTDFELTLDGIDVSLDGLTVMGSGDLYTIDLTTVTTAAGEYVFTLVAEGSEIVGSNAGLAADASDSWVVNTAPEAVADELVTLGNVSLTFNDSQLLENDSDADGDGVSLVSVGEASNGTVVDNQDGSYVYTPNSNFQGTDAFSYTISDGLGATDSAVVSVEVTQSWQNGHNPLDVDNNESVEPRDALVIINYINSIGNPASLPGTFEPDSHFLDVNNNGVVDPNDVLRVINFINNPNAGSGEGIDNSHSSHKPTGDNEEGRGEEAESYAALVDEALLLFEW